MRARHRPKSAASQLLGRLGITELAERFDRPMASAAWC
jgi:hypothetical protein